jgi:hypothetical protein
VRVSSIERETSSSGVAAPGVRRGRFCGLPKQVAFLRLHPRFICKRRGVEWLVYGGTLRKARKYRFVSLRDRPRMGFSLPFRRQWLSASHNQHNIVLIDSDVRFLIRLETSRFMKVRKNDNLAQLRIRLEKTESPIKATQRNHFHTCATH